MDLLNEYSFCIPNTTVYHEVSASTEAFIDKGKIFKVAVNYINRFINLKSRYNTLDGLY